MADSTGDVYRAVYERELKPKFGNQKLAEITHEDLRALTDAIVERGASATAIYSREVVMQVPIEPVIAKGLDYNQTPQSALF